MVRENIVPALPSRSVELHPEGATGKMKIDQVIGRLAMIKAHIGNTEVVAYWGGDDYNEPSYFEPDVEWLFRDKVTLVG
jgi:hypothetical protein